MSKWIDIKDIDIDAKTLNGKRSSDFTRYSINITDAEEDFNVLGYGYEHLNAALGEAKMGSGPTMGFGVANYKVYLHTTASGASDAQRIYFCRVVNGVRQGWEYLANMSDLKEYVKKSEIQNYINMQLSETQSKMGGGVTVFPLGDLLVTVTKKGGRHEQVGRLGRCKATFRSNIGNKRFKHSNTNRLLRCLAWDLKQTDIRKRLCFCVCPSRRLHNFDYTDIYKCGKFKNIYPKRYYWVSRTNKGKLEYNARLAIRKEVVAA